MTVTQRGNTWLVYVKQGTRRWRIAATSEATGLAIEAELRAALREGREPDLEAAKATASVGERTLADVADHVARRYWNNNRGGPVAIKRAQAVLRILGSATPIRLIDQAAVERLIDTLERRGNSPATVNRHLAALSKLLTVSLRHGWIDRRPHLERQREPQGRVRFLSQDEEARLLHMTRQIGKPEVADLWAFLLDSGARVGEALGLKWQDVGEGTVTFWDTKNGHPRTVPLTTRARALLAHRSGPSPYPLDYSQVRQVWDRVRSNLGYADDPQWVIHTLRHTTASRLAQAGVPLQVIKEYLGHKTLAVTLRYAHLCPDNLAAAAMALDVAQVGPGGPTRPVAHLKIVS